MPVAIQAVPFLAVLLSAGLVLWLVLGPWGAAPVGILALFVLFFFRTNRIPEMVSANPDSLHLG